MQAQSSQRFSNPRTGAITLVATSVFVAGVALGAVVTSVVAPQAPSMTVESRALDPDAGLREQRDGEINAGSVTDDAGLRQHRDGEINAGAASNEGTWSIERRENINRGP